VAGLGEHFAEGAVDDAVGEQAVVEQHVEERAFEDQPAAPLDEAELGEARQQLALHVGLVAEHRREVGQQRGFRQAAGDLLAVGQRGFLAEHVVLAVVDELLAVDLAFALGQHDQRPDDHQQGDLVAGEADVAGGVFAAGAEDGFVHVVGEGHRHVLGVGVVDELQADGGEAGFELGAEGFVHQRAAHLRVGARQAAAGQQAGGEGAGWCSIRLRPGEGRWRRGRARLGAGRLPRAPTRPADMAAISSLPTATVAASKCTSRGRRMKSPIGPSAGALDSPSAPASASRASSDRR
jgi:hypothetical protein